MNNNSESVLSGERRDSLVLLLAWAAGSVDAIAYLGLGHVFTANMTGNMVLLGLTLGQGQGLAAIANVVALAGFVFGVIIGAVSVAEGGKPGEWDRRVSRAFLWEGMLIAAFTVVWHVAPGREVRGSGAFYALIALSAMAMGLQSAAVRRLNLPGVATTYVTGTMTSVVAGLTSRLLGKAAESTGKEASVEKLRWKHQVRLQAGVLVTYGLAAVASGLFQKRVPRLVAVTPLVAVALVLLIVSFSHRQRESRGEGV
ncbi:MAG TPA: YoaK family protein [Candidatus Acidoferrales bacterium]|nr:YoaK family protein [Candidatus Acidoferrales bacterium]